jgi:hypothetical protein
MTNTRRDFIKAVSMAAGAAALPGTGGLLGESLVQTNRTETAKVSGLKKPVAIAMWDFSWILRHHRYGEFLDWDSVLEGLAERGYNAIRMDAMPQYVAADTSGKTDNEFRSIKDGWRPSLWGNDYTMSFRPREALLEFLPKCKKYGIKTGLATWFIRHGTERKEIFMEEVGLLRAWDETLAFLKASDLLGNVLYVDLLNEYPNWHGYDWLKNKLNDLSDIEKLKLNNPEANLPEPGSLAKEGNPYQQKFYNDFISNLIKTLKVKYPELDFHASIDSSMDLDKIDLSQFNALDYHIWFAHTNKIPGLREVSAIDQTQDYRKVYSGLLGYWKENKSSLVKWMDGRLTDISSAAHKQNIVCGNTEGWGPIFWFDHPELDWKWVKESGSICVDLAKKHENYKFICTSNFTHPQFRGMWEDINWHRQITSTIKS